MSLDNSKIKYIAFEGGGGKGNAYLGAINAIDEYGLTSQIKGYSGSSAGAIMSFLLSCDYSYGEIKELWFHKNFFDFFDKLEVGREMTILGAKDNLNKIPFASEKDYQNKIKDPFGKLLNFDLPFEFATWILKKMKENKMSESELENKLSELIFNDNQNKRLRQSLALDYGLLSGEKIFNYFNDILRKAIYKKLNIPNDASILFDNAAPFVTFKQHYETFHRDLRVTAVNLHSQQLQILSHDTTPNLPVALAIRMSMSIPFLFKPVTIYPEHLDGFTDLEKEILPGYWVDGGLYDNAPARLYEKSETILFRLGIRDAKAPIADFTSFVLKYMIGQMSGSAGSGQVTKTTFDINHIVSLEIGELDTFTFNVTSKRLEELERKNYKITSDFLVPNKILDWE